MPGLRKVVDERDARRCLLAVSRSGETRREWARRHGVDGRSLRAWELNMSRSSKKGLARSAPAQLVELVPTTIPVVVSRYVVRAGPGSVEVGDDFHPATLRRIVEVLLSC